MTKGKYYGYGTKRYSTTVDGHQVDLDFDKSRIVLNQARLYIDGHEVDRENVFYGEKELTATLPDGTKIEVIVDSGMVGEMRRAQVRSDGGTWTDLEPVTE